MRRSRFEKCSGADADYLRVLGNRGQADAFYCGQDSAPNATFAAGDAVALLFKSSPREEGDESRQDVHLLQAFMNQCAGLVALNETPCKSFTHG